MRRVLFLHQLFRRLLNRDNEIGRFSKVNVVTTRFKATRQQRRRVVIVWSDGIDDGVHVGEGKAQGFEVMNVHAAGS